MSNKKNLSAEETDLTRRKLLTSAGILAMRRYAIRRGKG